MMKQFFNFSNKTSSTLRTSLLYKTILTLLTALTFSGNTFAAWSGSGEGVKKSGTWYVLYEDGEQTAAKRGGTKEYTLLGPGKLLTFQGKYNALTSIGSTTISVSDNKSTSLWSGDLYKSYASITASNNCHVDATKITFTNNSWATYACTFKTVHVTMAQYLNDPTKTDLDCGTADINSESTSGQVDVAWCNVPAMSYEITDDAEGLFSVSVDVNSEAGKYNTSQFTVTYKHTKAGTHTAQLKITDSYNSYSKTVNLTGTTNKLQPEVTWSPDDVIFNVDDVLTATNANNLTVTLSGNSTYVTCSGNQATMKAATSGTITITAHVTGNDIYADRDITKDITITNLEKQYITWTQDFSRLKTTDATKSIVLSATASSGLPVTYELSGDKTGLSLSKSGNTWTLTYSASECKNTTILAKQAGDGTYAPASAYSLPIKVVDPTKVCDESETLVNSTITMKDESNTYNIDIPNKMYVSVSRTKQGLLDIYLVGVDFEFYSGRNGTGTKLYTKSYGASDINKSISNSEIDLSSYINAKSVKVVTTSTNGYNINKITYTHQKYCTLSTNSLDFATYPSTTASAKKFKVNYANYPISLECSNNKFSFTPKDFGDCSEYGSQEISVTYTAGADEGEDVGYIYVKDNTGATLQTCTLNVTISKVEQSITSTSIGTSYKTTDRIELSPEANSGLTEFTYSATPAGVASFDGNVMTFLKSGTITITVTQPGNNVYKPTSTTVQNVVVSKVNPDLTLPTIETEQTYNPNVKVQDCWSGGSAKDDKKNTVTGTFTCDFTLEPAKKDEGYIVTFTPDNINWYNTVTQRGYFTNVKKADQAITNWGLENGAEYQTGADMAAGAEATSGLTVTFITGNENIATIDANNKLVVVKANEEVTIHARQVGNGNWNSVDSVRTIITAGAQPNNWNEVSATDLIYGQPLQASTLSGSVKFNDNTIDGTLAWTNPTIVPAVGNNQEFEVTFTPDNTDAYAEVKFNVTISVAKATPELTWHIGNAIREKSTYRNPVTSSNTETPLNIEVTQGANIASWTENGLVIGELTGESTTIKLRISQAGNDNYNAIAAFEKTITIEKKYVVCVPVTFDRDSYNNAVVASDVVGNVGWCDTDEDGSAKWAYIFNVTYTQHKGIYLGSWDGGTDYSDKSVILSINGVPDRIKFVTASQTVHAINIDFPQTSPKWKIEQSSNGEDWVNIYSGTDQVFEADQELVHSTRYVKVTYSGNMTGYLTNIQITRQHYLSADKDALTFGTAAHPLQAPQELTLSYSSIGSCENPQGYIDLSIDNPAFYVDVDHIEQNVDFDQFGTYKVYVRCTDINQTGTLTITGSDGTTTSVDLSSENIEITSANAADNLIYTGTEHAALNGTPYRGMQPLNFTNCFDNGTPRFDSLYIYGVTDNVNQTVATVQGNDYQIPTFTVTDGSETGTAHTPCYVYAKNGNKYTYVRSFDAANKAQEIAAPAKKLWLGGYKPAAIPNAAVVVSGNGGTRTDLYLDNVEFNNGQSAIVAQSNNGAEAFTLALHAEGTNKITSIAAAALQIGANKGQIVIEDSWCNATSAMITLTPAAGKPSIELGNAQCAVVVNGTQLNLKNGNPLAIAYTENGEEQTTGSVVINDGTIIGETELHFPAATRIYGGTFNDGQVRVYTAAGFTYPTNEAGERLLRKPMAYEALPAGYGKAHLTKDNLLKVNPILKDEGIYIFVADDGNNWNNDDNWDGDIAPGYNADVLIDANVNVVGDVTVNDIVISENKTVTVTDGASLTINGSTGDVTAYGNIVVKAGGQLNLGSGNVHVNDFTLYSGFAEGQPKSGQVSNSTKIHANGNAYFILDLDPAGEASYGWYDFTVPFPVNVMTGVARSADGINWDTNIQNEKNYAVMAFYEELRAQDQYAWKKFRGILEPGRAYTMTIDSKINTYRFAMTQEGTFNTTMTQTLEASAEGEENGWNGVGNGTMQYIKLSEQPVVQMYQHTSNVYLPVDAGSQAFAVGSAYFVQKSEQLSQLTLVPVQDATSVLRAPQREREADERFGVTLTQDGKTCDNLFVTCSDEATTAYTRGKDVQKMGDIEGAKIARLWTNAKGKNLCAIYTACTGNETVIPMNIYAPAAGAYNIALTSLPEEDIYLTRNGVIVWDLTMSDYTLDLNAGTDNTYALMVVRRINNTATGVDATDNDKRGTDFVEKIIVNDQLFILRDGIMYDAQGKRVTEKY